MAGKLWARLALPSGLALFALAFLRATADLPVPPFGGPVTARAFPMILGFGLLLAALLLLLEGRGATPPAGDAAPSSPAVPAAIAGWTLAYVALLEPAGFILATSVFLGGLMLAFHRGHPWQAVAVAIGFSVLAHQLFVRALGVALPDGMLF